MENSCKASEIGTFFPLATPDEQVRAALEKAWQRGDFERYLQRWQHGYVPTIPAAFYKFSTRAIDIGCGFGKYILAESAKHPQRAFLGIDKGNLRAGHMQKRVSHHGRSNLFGIHGNAIPLLAQIARESIDALTIFYPNPWWPAKHRKKRWAYHPLLPILGKILKVGGQLCLTSNEPFYLSEFLYAVQNHPKMPAMDTLYAGPVSSGQAGRTHFETKFLQQGVACGELHFRKTRPSP